MSAAESQALGANGLQLVGALERYVQDTALLIAAWPDLERYRGVSEQVETIRMYSAALPPVRVQWVELLIAHAELVHVLWRVQYGGGGGCRARATGLVQDRHAASVAALRERCVRVLADSANRREGLRSAQPTFPGCRASCTRPCCSCRRTARR